MLHINTLKRYDIFIPTPVELWRDNPQRGVDTGNIANRSNEICICIIMGIACYRSPKWVMTYSYLHPRHAGGVITGDISQKYFDTDIWESYYWKLWNDANLW